MIPNLHYPSYFVFRFLALTAWLISKPLWFIRFKGCENIPPAKAGGILIVANHQTYLDPVWISIKMRRKMQYMAYDKAFEWNFVGALIKYLGSFPVKHPIDTSTSFVKRSLVALRDGAGLIIFPEGAREFADGELMEFKTGAVHLAQRAGVQILPVSIIGGERIWPQKQRYPNLFRPLTLIFHPPMTIDEHEDLSDATARIKAVIERGIIANKTLTASRDQVAD